MRVHFKAMVRGAKSALGALFRHTQYKQAGFDSFADYMNERQPCGIKRAHAYALIQAMKIRPLLPEIPGPPENAVWTETSIRPLLHKDFTPADQWCPGASIFTGQPLKIR